MNAVTVINLGDHIGPAKFPVDDSFFHILFKEREGKFASDSLADRQPAQTIYPGFVFKGVLITFRVLIQWPDAAFYEIPN